MLVSRSQISGLPCLRWWLLHEAQPWSKLKSCGSVQHGSAGSQVIPHWRIDMFTRPGSAHSCMAEEPFLQVFYMYKSRRIVPSMMLRWRRDRYLSLFCYPRALTLAHVQIQTHYEIEALFIHLSIILYNRSVPYETENLTKMKIFPSQSLYL